MIQFRITMNNGGYVGSDECKRTEITMVDGRIVGIEIQPAEGESYSMRIPDQDSIFTIIHAELKKSP